jgi:hypothetical protein
MVRSPEVMIRGVIPKNPMIQSNSSVRSMNRWTLLAGDCHAWQTKGLDWQPGFMLSMGQLRVLAYSESTETASIARCRDFSRVRDLRLILTLVASYAKRLLAF